MNKTFRIVWSAVRGAYIVAHEKVASLGKPSSLSRSGATAALVAGLLGAVLPAPTIAAPAANALPANGQIVGGAAAGSIATAGNAMTVTQNQQRMIANWESFSIGSAASVHFQQPTGGVALNRVTGTAPSEIFGKLSSTGSVFLTNPNGVLFGRTALVDVGSLVATTMKIGDSDFMAGNLRFSEGNGSVVNLGKLTAQQAGYIALLAPEVRNEGVITASLGQVVLGGAEAVTLSHDSSGLQYAVDKGAVQALVENRGLVEAEGGQVLLSARAANQLASAVINNAGTIEARGLVARGGKIMLEADHITLAAGSMLDASGATGGGEVLVGGGWQGSGGLHQATTVTMEQGAKIDVSATKVGAGGTAVLWSDIHNTDGRTTVAGNINAEGAGGGAGGQVETSGHRLSIADSASVRTGGGQWLLDPYDFTIGTDITGAALSTALGSGNVSITTTNTDATCTGATCGAGSSSGNGDIIFNDAVSWSANRLTLSAYRHVDVNNVLGVSGTGALTVTTNTGGAQYSATSVEGYLRTKQTRSGTSGADTFTGKIDWASTGSLIINGDTYLKVSNQTELAAIGDGTNNAKHYFLANDITLTGSWTPIWSRSGKLEGLGHTISGLSVNQTTSSPAGLITYANNGALLQNIGLINSSVTSSGTQVGSFIGAISTGSTSDQVTLRNLFVGAGSTVTGTGSSSTDIGGLVGKHTQSYGTLRLVDSYNAASVNAGETGSVKLYRVGGLVGYILHYTYIADSYNVGEIVAGSVANKNDPSLLGDTAGGLVGSVMTYDLGDLGNYSLLKLKNYGNVFGGSDVGGIFGSYSVSPGAHTNTAAFVPTNLYNYGNIKGFLSVGGIAGGLSTTYSNQIAQLSYVTNSGAVESTSTTYSSAPAGGIVGATSANFTATAAFTGGIRISNAFNTGSVTAPNNAGGLVGYNAGYIYQGQYKSLFEVSNAYNAGAVSATNTAAVAPAGGLVGKTYNTQPTMKQAYNRGSVTSACTDGSTCVGGIIGYYDFGTANSFSAWMPNSANVYSVTGKVLSDNWVGYVKYGTFSYSNINASNPTGGSGVTFPTLDKTPNEMQTATLASLGFSTTDWGGGGDGTSPGEYPYLLGFTTPLTFTFLRDTSKVYGAANPSLALGTDYSLTGCSGCLTLSFNSSALGQWADAGNYLYSTNNLFTLGGNTSAYDISYAGTSYKMTVTPAALSVTGTTINNKTYTGTNAASFGSYGSLSGILNSDDVSINTGTTSATFNSVNVANTIGVATSYALSGAKAGNYTVTNPTGLTANITQAPLTISPINQSKIYGSALNLSTLSTWAFTSTGLQNGEGIGNVTLAASGGTAATDNAGSYTLTPSAATSGTFSASNYSITYNTGTLTVNPALITLRASNQSKAYGSTLNLGTTAYSITSGTLKNSDTITGLALNSTGAVDTANVASYSIIPSAATGTGGFNTTNYTISYSNGTLTVNKAPLTITAANAAKTYDGNAYAGGNGVSYSGFVLGQDQTALGGTLSYAGTAQGASNAGSYSITPLGYSSGNYAFTYNNGTLTVDKKTVSLSAAKTYDGGTTLGAGTVTIGTGISGQSLSYSGATSFSKNVDDNATNYISALTLVNGTGGLASNYQLPTLNAANAPVTISKKDVSVTSISIADKVYDGTTNASSVQSTTLSGVVPADAANVNTSGTLAAFGGKDVGTYSISVTGLALTGSEANNYNLTGGTTATDASVAITARPLTVTASKTYDGTTSLLGFVTLGGFVGSETLNITSATASNSHVATASKYVSGITLADGDNGGVTGNYSLPAYSYSAGINSVTINAATLTPTLTNTGVTKVYDGDLTSGFTPTYSFAGLVAGDTAATLTNTARTYNDKDVLDASLITVSGLAISGIAGSNSSAASDYVLDATSKTVAATITEKPLTVSGLAASNKTYNALTDVAITHWGSVTTGVGAETLTLNHGTASFSDKNKANGKTVTAIGYSLADGSNGELASNYQLSSTSATTTANITAKTITLAGSTGVTKTYDGRTSMPLGSTGYQSLVGVESGDTVSITGAPVYDSANHGVRTILQNTVAIAGTDAGNYLLSWSDGSGTINPASLTITANADAKFVTQADVATYNGVSYSGFVNGETTAVLDTSGLGYTRSNAGTNAAGTYAGVLQPSGVTANNGNYSISYVNGDYTIVPAGQLLVRVSNAATTYGTGPTYSVASAQYLASDNTTIVDLSGSVVQSGSGNSSVVITDGASGTANFTLGPVSPATSTANWLKAGSYNLGASSIAESSPNFSNTLTVVGGLTVDRKAMTANASNVVKTYDGTTGMNNVVLGYSGLVASDLVSISGNGNFATKDVGTGKNYTVSSVTLGGSDADNYYLTGGDSFSGSNGEVTKKAVSLSAAKVYDGSTSLAGYISFSGLIGSETLNYTGATANSKDVLVAAYVDAITLQDGANGGLAGNYQLPSMTQAGAANSATITRKTLTMTGHTAEDKTFNGLADAVTALGSLNGMVGSETLAVSGTGAFADPNVGVGKTVTIHLALADGANGGLASNYTISDATTMADINPQPTTVPPPPPSVPTAPTPPAEVPTPPPPPEPPGEPSGTPAPSGNPILITLTSGTEIPLATSSGGQGESSSSGNSAVGGNGGSGFLGVRSFGVTSVPVDSLFSFTLPKDTFKHADPKTTVMLEARLADGKPLPPWLQFDPGAGRFTGRAPQGVQEIEVRVVARDNSGNEATTRIVLRFSAASEVKKQ